MSVLCVRWCRHTSVYRSTSCRLLALTCAPYLCGHAASEVPRPWACSRAESHGGGAGQLISYVRNDAGCASGMTRPQVWRKRTCPRTLVFLWPRAVAGPVAATGADPGRMLATETETPRFTHRACASTASGRLRVRGSARRPRTSGTATLRCIHAVGTGLLDLPSSLSALWAPHPPSDSPSLEHHSHPLAHIIQVEPRTPDSATETKGPRGAVPIKPSEQARGAEREPRLSVGFASA